MIELPQCKSRRSFPVPAGESICSHENFNGQAKTLADCVDCPFSDLAQANQERSSLVGSVSSFVSGAVGVAKAYFGTEEPPREVVNQRYKLCEACEKNLFGKCDVCNCFIGAKIRLSSQSCPLQKWLAYNGDIQPVHRSEN